MDERSNLLKTAIKDPVVRLAALGGAGVGALLVLGAVMLLRPEAPPPRTAQPVAAPKAAPGAQSARKQAPAPAARSTVAVVPARPVETYPQTTVIPPADPGPAAAPVQSAYAPVVAPSATGPDPDPSPAPADQAAKPRIAIIIDDVGVDRRRSARAVELPAKVTLSFLAYAPHLKDQAAAARAKGHEIMLHVAMEPESPEVDPGPNVLLSGTPPKELRAALEWNLSQLDGFIGVNNHMGSRFTRDMAGMRLVMAELKSRGLFFVDSLTSRESVGAEAAREAGVAFAKRDIFIDHKDDEVFVLGQLAKVKEMAAREGLAIAIGHPRDITLKALETWLPAVQAEGFELIGASDAVRRPAPLRGQLAGTSG